MGTMVNIIDCDNYTGVYFDEKLVYYGCSYPSIKEIIQLCEGHSVELHKTTEASLEWLDEIGVLPNDLKDVKISHMGRDIPIYQYWEEKGI